MENGKQMKVCSTCKLQKLNEQNELICSLTNAPTESVEECTNYEECAKSNLTAEHNNNQQPSSAEISGWLAFFLWFGVGIGALVSCISLITSLAGSGITPIVGFLYFCYGGALLATAIFTILAFHKRKPNAVALAKTYIVMIASDGLLNLVLYAMLDDADLLKTVPRQFIWAIVWYTYLVCSEKVKQVIPIGQRVWGNIEKILIVVYLGAMILIVTLLSNFLNDPTNSSLYNKDFVIEASIEAANESLPDYSDPSFVQLPLKKDDISIYYTYKFNQLQKSQFTAQKIRELSLVSKEQMLQSIASETDKDEIDGMKLFLEAGYSLVYRYLGNDDEIIYEVIVSLDEFNKAISAGENFKCNLNSYMKILKDYVMELPIEYMGDAILTDIQHTDNSLHYFVQLTNIGQDVLSFIDEEYLENYVKENWEALDNTLMTFASLNKEDIIYHFMVGDKEHAIITITPEFYSQYE